LTSLLRTWLDTRLLLWINRLSGVVIIGFGLIALASLAG
jgi:threonine/homoserine/homoserine lactone efflux protein